MQNVWEREKLLFSLLLRETWTKMRSCRSQVARLRLWRGRQKRVPLIRKYEPARLRVGGSSTSSNRTKRFRVPRRPGSSPS